MVVFGEMFGLVDRGTPGARGGAVVADVWSERFALDRIMRRAHNDSWGDRWAQDQNFMRLHHTTEGASRIMRHEEWCEVEQPQHEQIGERNNSLALHFLRRNKPVSARSEMARSCNARLAALAPCYAVVAAGHAKRLARGGTP